MPSPILASDPGALSPEEWRALRSAHLARLEPVLLPQRERRARHERHPVLDFLFEYYPFRVSNLLRWTPGVGVVLLGGEEYLSFPHFTAVPGGAELPVSGVPANRIGTARRTLDLLEATQGRAPFLGCLGLHEWAMVHDPADVRHREWPLRLGAEGTRAVVDAGPVRCTHYDAFRFFSRSARPLNQVQPGPDNRAAFEQPGCLHANMDLYKHASKLYPWLPSETLADAFLLAHRAREVDMRASPYDLSALGYAPIRIETPEGQAEYRRLQRGISADAAVVRATLIAGIRRFLALTAAAGCATEHAVEANHEQ